MPLYQLIEKNENIAKRNFFEFACFLTGLITAWDKTPISYMVQNLCESEQPVVKQKTNKI
jgi:hypothetical protein